MLQAGKRMHVLLFDPVPISQRMLSKVLKETCSLTVVGTIGEANINISRTNFDALLISAEDTVEEALIYSHLLRQSPSPMMQRPIVLITSRYSEDLAFQAWRNGITMTVAKPLRVPEFTDLLQTQVEQHCPVPIERSQCIVQLISWRKGGLHYLYAPDLNRLVSAASPEQAQARMNELFEQFHFVFQDSRFGEARVRVDQQKIDLDSWKPSDHADSD